MSSITKMNEKKEKLELLIKLVNDDWDKIQELSKHSYNCSSLEIDYRYLINQLNKFNVILGTNKQYAELVHKYDSISKQLELTYSTIYQERMKDLSHLVKKIEDVYNNYLDTRGSNTTLYDISIERLSYIYDIVQRIKEKHTKIELKDTRENISILTNFYNELVSAKRELLSIDESSKKKDD